MRSRFGKRLAACAVMLFCLLSASSRSRQEVRVWESGPCDPPVAKVVIGEVQAKAVEERLMAIFMEDQKARQSGSVDLAELNQQDVQRRKEVLQYLQAGEVASGPALYSAAMVLQHGNCPEYYLRANELAGQAVERGMQGAKWLYAATLDRYLLSLGKPQKFGTQYQAVGDKWELLPVDPTTTDEERAQYDLPPLSQAKNLHTPVPKTTPDRNN